MTIFQTSSYCDHQSKMKFLGCLVEMSGTNKGMSGTAYFQRIIVTWRQKVSHSQKSPTKGFLSDFFGQQAKL